MSTAIHPLVQPGDILAEKYRVEQVLGSGGMGVVVAAEHIELRERVAIKFLLDAALDNVELAERFLREARAAVKIKSEHVVRVIDVGRLPSGAPYMVMEYLDGEDLSQCLERGPLPIEDAVDYIVQSCEAMSVAHRSGIIHRDLKPANLFLTHRPDGSAIIKVLDFGISKVSSPEAAQLSLTHTQAMMGSPLYMSPEQMRSSKDVDRRADIWSLGVILHELLAGDVPFSGSTFPEVLVQVMAEPPSSLRAARPEVPEALEAVVLRCLAKSPEDRFSSVSALAVALAPFASSRTLSLQGRLARSMSGPAPAVLPPLIATRIEAAGAPAAPKPEPGRAVAAGTLPSVVAAVAPAALPPGTHTAWEGRSQPAPHRRWWLGLAALGVFGFGAVVATRFGASREPSPPEAAGAAASQATGAATAASVLPAPPVAAAPVPAAPPVAPITPDPGPPVPAAPSVAPVSVSPDAPSVAKGSDSPGGARAATAPGGTAGHRAAPVKSGSRGVPRAQKHAPAPASPPAPLPAPSRQTPPPTKPRSLSIEFK